MNLTIKIILSLILSMTTHSSLPHMPIIQKLGIGTGITGIVLASNKWQQKSKDEKVLIYHTAKNEAQIRSIKRSGLCSGEGAALKPWSFIRYCKDANPELAIKDCAYYYFENLVMCSNHKNSLGFADQYSVIFFKPEEPGIKESAHIAIEVDPHNTYVYNMEHRARAYECDPEVDRLYRQSKVLLADYLKYLDQAKKMVEERPNVMVLLDPETAKPFYLEKNDPKKHQVKIDGQWVEYKGMGCQSYNAEVIVKTTCIPPKKLIFLNDKISSHSYSMPVINKVDYLKK